MSKLERYNAVLVHEVLEQLLMAHEKEGEKNDTN